MTAKIVLTRESRTFDELLISRKQFCEKRQGDWGLRSQKPGANSVSETVVFSTFSNLPNSIDQCIQNISRVFMKWFIAAGNTYSSYILRSFQDCKKLHSIIYARKSLIFSFCYQPVLQKQTWKIDWNTPDRWFMRCAGARLSIDNVFCSSPSMR